MAKTIFDKLGSQDILSAHINGLGYTINNIENVLQMQTKEISDEQLQPVTDMDDASIRYRIYEGETRSWVKGSATIKRNGIVVEKEEYVIQESFGVVVFNTQQLPSDEITVSATCIKEGSEKINSIDQEISRISGEAKQNKSSISSIQGEISNLKSEDTNIKQRLQKLESGGGGSSSGSSGEGDGELTDIAIDGYMAGGGSLNSQGKYEIPKGDRWITHTTKEISGLSIQEAVAVSPNTIDAFPIYVSERVVVDKVKIKVDKNTSPSGKLMIAIYSTANGVPHRRLAQTEVIQDTVIGEREFTFKEQKVRLEAGIYWLARWSNFGVQYSGLNSDDVIHLVTPGDMANDLRSSYPAAGIRANYGNDAIMPFEFPMTSAKAFSRPSYVSPQLHIIKSYV